MKIYASSLIVFGILLTCLSTDLIAAKPEAEILSVAPNFEALSLLGIDPGSATCVPIKKEALNQTPPPPPMTSSESTSANAARKDFVRVCPDGFVPKYEDSSETSVEVTSSSVSCSVGGFWYAGAYQGRTSTTGYGVTAALSIHNPALANACDMSTGQISVVKGPGNNSVVETGMRKFWDNYPKLMIGHWRNGVFFDDTGFVYTHPTYSNNMNLSAYIGSIRQFSIHYNSAQGNWWVWFNNGWVGYFPGSLWNGSFTRADVHHWYGEVLSANGLNPPLTDMGSGIHASSSQAAKMFSMWTLNNAGVWGVHSTQYVSVVSNPSYYSLQFTGNNSLRYGGPGN